MPFGQTRIEPAGPKVVDGVVVVVDGIVVEGAVVEGTVVEGTVVEGTVVDGIVVELMPGVVPMMLAPPEALDDPMPGVEPTVLPNVLGGVPVMGVEPIGAVVTAPGVVGEVVVTPGVVNAPGVVVTAPGAVAATPGAAPVAPGAAAAPTWAPAGKAASMATNSNGERSGSMRESPL